MVAKDGRMDSMFTGTNNPLLNTILLMTIIILIFDFCWITFLRQSYWWLIFNRIYALAECLPGTLQVKCKFLYCVDWMLPLFTFYDYNVFLSRERLYSVGGLFERSNLRESHIDVIFSIQQFLFIPPTEIWCHIKGLWNYIRLICSFQRQ